MGERATARLRVILADDHELVLQGLRVLQANENDIEVVAAATDDASLLSRCKDA